MKSISVDLEFRGEFDPQTHLLIGIWVSFPGSWRIPSLSRDVPALIQTLRDYCKGCSEGAFRDLTLLKPEELIRCSELFESEILNALGSTLDWQV